MVKNSIISILLLVLPVGCTTTDSSTVLPEDFVRKPVAEKTKIVNLAPGDSIELSVEVDGRMEVSGHRAELNYTGIVTLPLVGDVKIGNMTLSKARGAIAKTYGVYFVNTPVIMISRVDDAAVGEWGFVTVTGRVSKPGRVKIPSAKGLKLTAVIQEAGGFSASAKKSAIRISRTDKNGRKIQVEVDFGEIGRNGNLKADIDLMDGDSVYIPERIF